MALIKCPECSTQISDKADACPSCGYPIAKNVADNPNRPNSSPQSVAVVKAAKSRGLYIILGLFLGWLGIHNFYAGFHGRGAAQLIITTLLGWLYIGVVITAIWALIEVCTITEDATGDKMV
jgi:TM2 domain-containing membrane protein YozV